MVTSFESQKPGHLARNCALNKFPLKASSQPAVGRGNGGQFGGSLTGCGQPPKQRHQRPQLPQHQQQRPPQRTNRSSSSASRCTRPDRRPFLEGRGVPGGHTLLLFTNVMLEAVRFSWRHRAIGGGRSDRVFASLSHPHSTFTSNPDPFSVGAMSTIAAISKSPCVKLC